MKLHQSITRQILHSPSPPRPYKLRRELSSAFSLSKTPAKQRGSVQTQSHSEEKMASAVSMSVPVTVASQKGLNKQPTINSDSFFRPLPMKQSKISVAVSSNKFQVQASFKEKAISGLAAGILTASMVVPQVAEAAAGSGVSPSLKNFLLSIVAGGVVLVAIGGAVVGVSYFDPVKRG